jgi:hypothetical protein
MLATIQKIHDMYDFFSLNLDFLTKLGFSHLLFVGLLFLSKDCNIKRSSLVPISNHQTSKFSRFRFKTQNVLKVFWIWGFEGQLGPPTHGEP